MKKLILLSLLSLVLSATAAFAFDPSLATRDGLAVKVEAEGSKYQMNDGIPLGTLQLYGAGAVYQNKGLKVNLSVGSATLGIAKAFESRDYKDTTPYVALGVSQQLYEVFGAKLGLFADGTYVFRLKDTFEGADATVNGLNVIRTGAIVQYEVIKNLNVYGGINGQWLNATVRADGDKASITNSAKLNGFAGAKYDWRQYTFDVNVGCADHAHVSANVSYNF